VKAQVAVPAVWVRPGSEKQAVTFVFGSMSVLFLVGIRLS